MATVTDGKRRYSLIVAVLAMTGVIAAGIQTLVVPLIGQLPSILDASPADTAWVVTVTLLTSAVAVPISGRLGDLFGKKPVIVASLLPLIAGSVVCALAASLVPMIVGRGMQGLGLGVVPLGISLLREVVPAERMGSAVSTMSASMGVGGALGLPFAAVLAQTASWRVMFWAFGGLAVVALVLIIRYIPGGTTMRQHVAFDGLGALWLSIGLVCLLLGISKGAEWGWSSEWTLGLGFMSVLALTLWATRQLRFTHPLVNLRTLADRRILLTHLASVLISFSTYPLSYVVPRVLQLPISTGYGLGQSMLAMALWLAPGGLAMLAIAPLSARLSTRRGPKTTLVTGALVIAAGFASAIWLMNTAVGLMAVAMLCNVGIGFAYAAIPLIIMDVVPSSETASANGFNTLARAIGTSTAGAVIGGLLANSATLADGYSVPSLSSLHDVLLLGCGVSLVAAALASALPSRLRSMAGPQAILSSPLEHANTL